MNARRVRSLAAVAILLATVPSIRAQSAAPAAPVAPIPNISTLMHQVLENQDRLDTIRENYACRDTREIDQLDKRGRIKKTETFVYQISFLAGHQIQRLIEKDGHPLDARAQRKEDNRIRKQVERYERQLEKDKGKQAARTRKAELRIQDFLEADRFFDPRRERVDGRAVIAFDFAANPAFHARSLTQKLAQSLVGTLWIDARAREVVRLDARFSKNFKIGWGLVASVHRGTAFAFDQTFVHHQVWLPTYVQTHVSARALFFGMNQTQIDRYTRYRRFHVRSKSAPSQPKPH